MMPYKEMPKGFHDCIDRLKKACEYLCSEGLYPEDSYYVAPPATDEELASVEKLTGHKLPKYYGDFLKIANGYKFINAEIYNTSRVGQSDDKIPQGYFAAGWTKKGTYRLSISPADGEFYISNLHPSGTVCREQTLFINEMYDLLEQLEKEVKKHKWQKEQDAKSPEEQRKYFEAIIERIDRIHENCPVKTSKKPENVRECIERMRRANELLINDYGYGTYMTFGKPASVEEIAKYEERLGFQLPQDYRKFIQLTGTVSVNGGDEQIFGFEDIGANDDYTPDGYLALSYTAGMSERLAMSEEDGEICLFWDLDPDPYTFMDFLSMKMEQTEEIVSEEYEREEKKKMRADGISEEDESAAVKEIIVKKWQKFLEENKNKKNE